MPLGVVLLLQALALCSGGEVLSQDKGACVDGAEGACLAGAQSLPEAEEQLEESAFIQERSSRTEPRRDVGSSGDLSASPQLEVPGFPTESFLTFVGGVNDTVNEIHKAVELVNATIAKFLGEVQEHSGSLAHAFDLAKSGAEHTKFILGEKAVKSVEKLVDKLAALSKNFIASANKTAGKAQEEMDKRWDQIVAKKDEIMDKMTDAEKQIQGIMGKNASLVLAQVDSRGPFGWLWRIFGFGRKKAKSPCEKAEESLASANSSVLEFEGLLDKLNSTVSTGFLDDLVSKLQDGLERFESAIQGVMKGATDSVPAAVKSALSKATDLFGKVAGVMKKQLKPVQKKVAKFLEEAKTPLSTARTSLSKSGSTLSKHCD